MKPRPDLVEETTTALTPTTDGGLVPLIERLVVNPDADVTKLEKLLDMQERMMQHAARAAFFAAFAEMQGELPSITERGEIAVNGQVRSRYARNEDIQAAIRPILQKHGFALSFRNDMTEQGMRITAVLSHRGGHTESDQFVCGPDTSGSKNGIQAMGSTRSYGQRYTTLSILNIITKGEDDDGVRGGAPVAPEGYDAWLDDLSIIAAEQGTEAMRKAWKDSKPAFRDFMTKHERGKMDGLKGLAAKADKAVQS